MMTPSPRASPPVRRVLHALDRMEGGLARLEQVTITVALVVMFIAAVAQVGIRYVGLPGGGTGEVAVTGMSFLTFIGSAVAIKTGDHIAVEVTSLIPSRLVQLSVQLVSLILLAIFSAYFAYLTYAYWSFVAASGETTLRLRIPATLPVGAIAVGAGLMVLHSTGALARVAATLLQTAFGRDAGEDGGGSRWP